nr:Lrp/AsnC family transcriptional regulator [Sphingomonas sp. CDS-1]
MDELNRQIIALLAENARVSNRDVALRLGVSEPTVAHRVRTMQAANVIRIVLQRNVRAAAQAHGLAILDVFVDDADAIGPVGQAIAGFDEILTVYETSRRPEIVAHAYAKTQAALGELVMTIGEKIAGLSRLNVSTLLSVNRYLEHIGNLEVAPAPVEEGSTPREKLLALLSHDARQTTKSLARALGLSETSVRHHMKMLHKEGFEAALVCDARAMGYAVWTELRVTVAAQHLRSALASLAHMPDITVTAHITGTANLMIFFSARTMEDLDAFVREHIRAMPGMIDFAIMRIPRVIKANYNMVL